MPERNASPDHTWVAAATVPVSPRRVRQTVQRQTMYVTDPKLRVDVLEVYCNQCRRPYEQVVGLPCEAFESNTHLRGGPGDRKRKPDPGFPAPAEFPLRPVQYGGMGV